MKHFFTLILFAYSLVSVAQVDDFTETDCEGITRSVYQVGDDGLPLIVASKGFDCGICQSQADDVLEFAQENAGTVEVWAAMINQYSPATPTCQNIDNWKSNHSWDESIFAFLDLEGHWVATGTPRYYVIHPSTKEIVYQGPSFSTATSTALSLVPTNTENTQVENRFQVYQSNSGIVVNKSANLRGELRIFNIVGQEVYSTILNTEADQSVINFSPIDGIYISSFYTEGTQLSTKFVFKN